MSDRTPQSDPSGPRVGPTRHSAAWADPTLLGTTIPNAINAGKSSGDNWTSALVTLDRYDPHRVFSNAFLDVFMP